MIKRNNMKLTAMSLLVGVSLMTGCGRVSASVTNNTVAKIQANTMSIVSEKNTSVQYDKDDYYTKWNEGAVTKIELGSSIKIDGQGAAVKENKITISNGGTYVISGKVSNGQIIVDSESKDTVRLVLNGVDITSSTSAPIYVKAASKIVISLEEGTENVLTDAKEYVLEEGSDEPDAAIFSKDDLTFNGTGSLIVNANYGDGITSKDQLKIMEGNITVNAADDGIKGKDMVAIKDGSLTIEAKKDGIKSTNSKDTEKGFIYTENGDFNIIAGGDGLQAESNLDIVNGQFNITTGGGSVNGRTHTEAFAMRGGMGNGPKVPQDGKGVPPSDAGSVRPSDAGSIKPSDEGMIVPSDAGSIKPSGEGMTTPSEATDNSTSNSQSAPQSNGTETVSTTIEDESTSMKAIKAVNSINILGGTFTIDSADDGIHSNNVVTISGGTLNIATGDDAIHADSELTVKDGKINITKSYEGLEAAKITVEGGTTHVVASDDGINASDGSSNEDAMGEPMHSSGTAELIINGGYLYVDASGDGLDANGSITMTGGVVIVNGPTNGGNGALDYDTTFNISGGTLIAAGSSQMAQTISTTSAQNAVNVSFTEYQKAGQNVSLLDKAGKAIISFTPSKNYQTVLISSPALKTNSTYTYVFGDTLEKKGVDGLAQNVTSTGGTTVSDFTISSVVTYLNESGVTTEKVGERGMRGPDGKRDGQYGLKEQASETNLSKKEKQAVNTTSSNI